MKQQGLLDDNSTVEPPEPIPNSEVKRSRADGSVGFPHVRVGHRQALILKIPNRSSLSRESVGDFFCSKEVCLLSTQELKKYVMYSSYLLGECSFTLYKSRD
jgi:hypothetical protein